MCSSAALLALLVGCSAAQAPLPTPLPAPTVAPTPAAAAAAAAAQAANTVSGTIDTVNDRMLTVTTNIGPKQVQLTEDAKIEQEGKGSPSDLLPGLGVGVTGKPDGNGVTAISIRIFPAALGTPRPGQFPMTGANQGNLMTNSVIESFDGSKLVLNAAGQRFEINVPSSTEVLKPVPATLDALVPGTRVLVAGTPAADGTLRATSINIMGAPPR
jgi:Domain of unknown function (DUF5666)